MATLKSDSKVLVTFPFDPRFHEAGTKGARGRCTDCENAPVVTEFRICTTYVKGYWVGAFCPEHQTDA